MPLPSAFPVPVLPDPQTVPRLRWGLLAPGGIAGPFVAALHAHSTQRVVAVGSRDRGRAECFARSHGVERAFGGYEQVVQDPEVDVVYVAAPPHVHRDLALLAVAAGKHVLVEKPFTVDAAQAREVAEAARAAGVLVMEAMWTRYLPQAYVVRRLLADGVLGEVRLLSADHGQQLDAVDRLRDPAAGGGALLDLGVYPVAFASEVLGRPSHVAVQGSLLETGVDAQCLLTLEHPGGAQAQLATTMVARTPTVAAVAGTEALLQVHAPFFTPVGLTLSEPTGAGERLEWRDTSGVLGPDGLAHQATALAGYVGEGRTESPLHTLAETASVMSTLDQARWALGYRFAGETPGD